MKKLSFLCLAAALVSLASCSEGGVESARDFASAVQLKDTIKINGVLGQRKAVWSKDVSFATINADSLSVEEIGEHQYRATAGDSTYFIFTELEKGYRVDSLKNIFTVEATLLDSVRNSGMLPAKYDDIDVMAAAKQLRDIQEKEVQQKALQAEKDAEIEKMLRKFYNAAVLDIDRDADYMFTVHCTEKMLKKLAAACDYEDGGYATWVLRTGYQDGDGDSKVRSITSLGDGWYQVDMLDMGFSCKKKLKVIEQNGSYLIDDYK